MKKKSLVIIGIIVKLLLLIAILIGLGIGLFYIKEQQRLDKKPYFTEYRLSKEEFGEMIDGFYVKTEPNQKRGSWLEDLNKSQWPDYSGFQMEATDETTKAVAVLNYYLFEERSEQDQRGIRRAEEMHFNAEKPITVEWVMDHPAEAAYIMDGMWGDGTFLKKAKKVDEIYDKIQADR